MSDSTRSSSGGIGFFGLLAIVFITLKLCNVIQWDWWIVLSPLWGPMALLLLIAAVCGSIYGVMCLIERFWKEGK